MHIASCVLYYVFLLFAACILPVLCTVTASIYLYLFLGVTFLGEQYVQFRMYLHLTVSPRIKRMIFLTFRFTLFLFRPPPRTITAVLF